MKIKKIPLLIFSSAVAIATICAGASYLALGDEISVPGLQSTSTQKVWRAISCRARLYVRKGMGAIPDLSWTELWKLTGPGLFTCVDGRSLESGLNYSARAASEEDRAVGARIFSERCVGCHGSDGSG